MRQNYSFSKNGNALLEPCEGKLSCTVLRGESPSNGADLLDNKHYGVDIAANPNESILATLDGTVILSTYTAETGYVIQIQHGQDFVSVYKHCGSLLKKEGDTVKGGEAIALVGNTGEKTTGSHLHFELWNKGRAINPSKYIVF